MWHLQCAGRGRFINENVTISYCKIPNHLHLGKWTEILQMDCFMSSEEKNNTFSLLGNTAK